MMLILERTANANADGDADVVGQTQAEPEGGAADTRRWLLLDLAAGRVIKSDPAARSLVLVIVVGDRGGGGSGPVPPCADLGGSAWRCDGGGWW